MQFAEPCHQRRTPHQPTSPPATSGGHPISRTPLHSSNTGNVIKRLKSVKTSLKKGGSQNSLQCVSVARQYCGRSAPTVSRSIGKRNKLVGRKSNMPSKVGQSPPQICKVMRSIKKVSQASQNMFQMDTNRLRQEGFQQSP